MIAPLLALLWLGLVVPELPLPRGADAWPQTKLGAVRGITVGPIENRLHPRAGYGTERGRAATAEALAMGATWIALTPFGRVWDLKGRGVDLTFEAPLAKNTESIRRAIRAAHRGGLRVMLVPHLWVETGGWRALIDPGTDAGWKAWAASYRAFVLHWAQVAADEEVELLSVGVELRSWVTRKHAPSFIDVIHAVRDVYPGMLTYSANWDDVHSTVVFGELDIIGVNAFFPLTEREDASFDDLAAGAERVASELGDLARQWEKPILLTEMGYTTRRDPAIQPWIWPEALARVELDQHAPALAAKALLAAVQPQAWCAGFFVWRTYADPSDVSQEAEYGFSPRGKLAELVLRDAFASHWAADRADAWAAFAGLAYGGRRGLPRPRARRVGLYPGWSDAYR
ncbi:MAG: hypothetical protein AAGA56_01230 [Myxococcota bacterium]